MKEWLKDRLGEITLKTALAALLFLFSIFIFSFLAHEIVQEDELSFDQKAFGFFSGIASPSFNQFMRSVSFFGASYFLFPAYVSVIVWLLVKRKKNDAINLAIIGASSFVLLHFLKRIFQRNRPHLPLFEDLKNYSFPSGHAVSSFVFCSALIVLIWKGNLSPAWKWIFSVFLLCFSILVGVSRIALRYHYASDVLAGFCFGFAWVFIFFLVAKKISEKKVKKLKRVCS